MWVGGFYTTSVDVIQLNGITAVSNSGTWYIGMGVTSNVNGDNYTALYYYI
jgi:hypothetical protein